MVEFATDGRWRLYVSAYRISAARHAGCRLTAPLVYVLPSADRRKRAAGTGWATLRLDRIICNVFGSGFTTGLEVLPDGSGWTLRVYGYDSTPPPATAFRIQRSDLYYDRGREFRWSYDGGELLIQTRSNNVLTVDKVTDDVVRIVTRFNRRHLLFRIGAPAFVRLDQFLECVENNYDRSLFEVVDCGAPPDTGAMIDEERARWYVREISPWRVDAGYPIQKHRVVG